VERVDEVVEEGLERTDKLVEALPEVVILPEVVELLRDPYAGILGKG
jgi:hypothetical protein